MQMLVRSHQVVLVYLDCDRQGLAHVGLLEDDWPKPTCMVSLTPIILTVKQAVWKSVILSDFVRWYTDDIAF